MLLERKQLNIELLHSLGVEFDVGSKYKIGNSI